MSFLFEDNILAKILIESKVFEQLNKYGQQVNDEAKLVAVKLTNRLMQEAVQASDTKSHSEVYVQDLVSLDSFLNFLLKNEERFDGELIVYHNATTADIQPPKPELYVKYKDFFVLKAGLTDRLRELDIASKQAGNEVMKPLLKNLIEEANKNLGLGFESHHENLPANPFDNDGNQKGQSGSKVQVPFAMNESTADPNYKNVSQKTEQQTLQQDLEQLRNVLPLQSTSSLSPYDMTLFIRSMYQLVSKHPKLVTGPMLGQFAQFNADIERAYAEWQSFVGRASSVASNAQSAREDVSYDLAGRPNVGLEMTFGNTPNAREAAARLLHMVKLVEQSITSINRSPNMTNLLGQDILSGQVARAKAFIDSLGPFAR
jgi:hypothetical protein